MNDFKNETAQKAVEDFRENQNPQNLLKVTQALISTPLLIPVQTDQKPDTNDKGDYILKAEMKLNLLGIRSKQGNVFFPFFTSTEQARKVYEDENIYLLPLSFEQYYPILEANKEKADGIVIDAKGANVPFRYDLLKGIKAAIDRSKSPQAVKGLSRNAIHKGDKIHLKNPEGNLDDLEGAIISSGFNEEKVNKIYLKERLMNPEKPEDTRWFIVVDASEAEPEILKRIGDRCKPFSHGKEFEFMFANQKLGRDIANSSKPIYEKLNYTI